ncbi:hypothetical protein [Niabella aurantiaca]|uniref:hypothetical protein n=1 Tax=Niabella aurantiaca TaxID=379900 RepID=UPI000366B497|nr:hypothetical protein [Niabella aurantiaca]
MKTRLLMMALMLGGHFYATAQVEKGSTLIGGNISFTSKNNDTTGKTGGGTAVIKAGRAFSENVVWGIFGIFSHSVTRSSSSVPRTHGSLYGGGIFNRLYKPLGKGFNLFGESSLMYAHTRSTLPYDDRKATIDQVGLGFAPGISYQILDWAQLELSLPDILSASYIRARPVWGDTQPKNNSFAVSTSLKGSTADLLGLGFTLLF